MKAPPGGGLIALSACVAGVVLAACAPARLAPRAPEVSPSTTTPAEREQIAEAEQAIQRDEAELRSPHVEAAPDCARVCQLVGNICTLAERICRIAGRYPATDPVAARCADDRARCQRARDQAQPRCACPAP